MKAGCDVTRLSFHCVQVGMRCFLRPGEVLKPWTSGLDDISQTHCHTKQHDVSEFGMKRMQLES